MFYFVYLPKLRKSTSYQQFKDSATLRKSTYILTILVGLILACNLTDKRTNSTSQLLPETDLVERLKYQKKIIDTFYNQNKDNVKVLVKLVDTEELIEEKNNEFDEIRCEKTFWILKDSSSKIIKISEQPYSKGRDWNIIFAHYFDKDGKTFAFERQTVFFNNICTNELAYETRTGFYDSDFNLIERTYKLVDEKNRTLKKDSCQFPYDYEYATLGDIDNYLQLNKIKNSW